jgi:hypothetical protein
MNTAWTDMTEDEVRIQLLKNERTKTRNEMRDAGKWLKAAVASHQDRTTKALKRQVELDELSGDLIGWQVTGAWDRSYYAIHSTPSCGYLIYSTVEPVLATDAIRAGAQGCNSCGRVFWMLKKKLQAEEAARKQAAKAS